MMIGLALESVRQQEHLLFAEELAGETEISRLPIRTETVRNVDLGVTGQVR
jgi:hypothetical protein